MMLGILPGESYSGIHVLVDLSVCVKYTNNIPNHAREIALHGVRHGVAVALAVAQVRSEFKL